MANYNQYEYLHRNISDALVASKKREEYGQYEIGAVEQYQIEKATSI